MTPGESSAEDGEVAEDEDDVAEDELDRVVLTGDDTAPPVDPTDPESADPLGSPVYLADARPKSLHPLKAVEVSAAEGKRRDDEQRRKDEGPLRRRIANGAIVLMVVQVAVADGIFIGYCIGTEWRPDPAALSAWSGATVVQVVAVVLVITRYLFPPDRGR